MADVLAVDEDGGVVVDGFEVEDHFFAIDVVDFELTAIPKGFCSLTTGAVPFACSCSPCALAAVAGMIDRVAARVPDQRTFRRISFIASLS
jgi:hypothetical protein